jgi:transposase
VDGQVLGVDQVVNDPVEFSMAIAKAGADPEVALEATYGWYWAADLLEFDGAHVHLVHPLGLHWDTRRVKNDVRDATELANRLRRGDLPEAFIAPPEQRELRELVRYRALCRHRHKARYAEGRIMPRNRWRACLRGMTGARSSA